MVLALGSARFPCSVRLPPTLVILSIAKDPALALAWRVNDGSCAWLRKLALFRAAAADSCHPEHGEGSRCGAGVARERWFLRGAWQGSLVPCGCRRAGYFPLGESNQSRPRDGPRPAARGALRCSPGASRRELAHPWARTGAPCSRARLRCSALANAGKVNGNSNSANVRWPWFLIFIPLRQRRDCAGKARRVSVWDTLTRRRPWMAIGAPRAGTRTRAAGAAVGVGFLWFLSLPTQRKEPARRQPHGIGETCDAARKNHRARARTTARSFAMLRMTTRGGRGTTRGNPVKRRERASKTPTRSVRQLNARARRARCSSSPGCTSANCPAASV